MPSTFEGTVLLEASAPVHAISLRGTAGRKNGFIMATLPIIDATQVSSGTAYLPQMVFGAEFKTEILVMTPIAGSVKLEFFSADGQPMSVSLKE
jgi:hypothetical protein